MACQAIALAQQGRWSVARALVQRYALGTPYYRHLFPPGCDAAWGRNWLARIAKWKPEAAGKKLAKTKRPSAGSRPKTNLAIAAPAGSTAAELQPPPLPLLPAQIPITFRLPDAACYQIVDRTDPDGIGDFNLRLDLARLELLQGFDELLCLQHVSGVDHYWYQIETVRKVLKQFRGRVLLADEVGLGKTIEAGMVLKEYLLRGMVERVLILTPSSLVGQWQEEMQSKFGLDFSTTQDPVLHKNPASFWSHLRIIASISTARREIHRQMLAGQQIDLVIVDEAHHLKNRSSKNWQLIDALKKRFLLLLSATPVQNNLVELYNLLTLLKPGIFETKREFCSLYMTPDNPRLPANRERLQQLMRDVMIRNTRALVDVRLPARHAWTLTVEAPAPEQECYLEMSRLLRTLPKDWASMQHLALHHLLEAAGSSPAAACSALERFLKHAPPGPWLALQDRYLGLPPGAKVGRLLELLERNPSEKKMVFVRFRATLDLLGDWFKREGIAFVRYDGQMSGSEKDAAIERFRGEAVVLLSTESGGEGRNLQFCNTLINFDLPWNPQAIEQRIGRIHRIGQTREAFVFNLATRNTVEEQILRILDEKINMFEMVVGEMQSILGEMDEGEDFGRRAFSAWVEQTEEARQSAFERLGDELVEAKKQYEAAKALDDELFGEEFEVL